MQAIVPANENFPALSGNFESDTAELIGELKVGKIVIERGWARFYLIWKGKLFLEPKQDVSVCDACGLEVSDDLKFCPRCGGHIVIKEALMFPTLEAYVDLVSQETGKSRQTIFNRLGTYRRLCDEKGANPIDVFAMNLISSGAARKLSTAEDDGTVNLVNDSWQDTIVTALSYDSKSEMLKFIAHDVMNEPQYHTELSASGDELRIYRETYPVDGDAVVEQYDLRMEGDWPEDMLKWLGRKINLKV
jgi:hypothetical protein